MSMFVSAPPVPHNPGIYVNIEIRQSGQYTTLPSSSLVNARIGPSDDDTNAIAPSTAPTKFNAELCRVPNREKSSVCLVV